MPSSPQLFGREGLLAECFRLDLPVGVFLFQLSHRGHCALIALVSGIEIGARGSKGRQLCVDGGEFIFREFQRTTGFGQTTPGHNRIRHRGETRAQLPVPHWAEVR